MCAGVSVRGGVRVYMIACVRGTCASVCVGICGFCIFTMQLVVQARAQGGDVCIMTLPYVVLGKVCGCLRMRVCMCECVKAHVCIFACVHAGIVRTLCSWWFKKGEQLSRIQS